VVGEGVVHVRDFDLRHVTAHAVSVAYTTCRDPPITFQIPAYTLCVAVKTDVIVGGDIVNQGSCGSWHVIQVRAYLLFPSTGSPRDGRAEIARSPHP
jgi:hypothetical protein